MPDSAVPAPAPATEVETALPAPHTAPATATPAAGGGDDADDTAADSDDLLWKIGLKVAWDIVVPGVAVEIEDGDSYFMLGDCNTVNQHCVLSGSASRFSSTHRNGLTEGMTWTGIHDAFAAALNVADANDDDDDDDAMAWAVRNAQLHTDVEEQWIRQFWVRSWTAACAKSPTTERRLYVVMLQSPCPSAQRHTNTFVDPCGLFPPRRWNFDLREYRCTERFMRNHIPIGRNGS